MFEAETSMPFFRIFWNNIRIFLYKFKFSNSAIEITGDTWYNVWRKTLN